MTSQSTDGREVNVVALPVRGTACVTGLVSGTLSTPQGPPSGSAGSGWGGCHGPLDLVSPCAVLYLLGGVLRDRLGNFVLSGRRGSSRPV